MMHLIVLMIALAALYIALSAQRGNLFENRYATYADLMVILEDFQAEKFTHPQLEKLKHLNWKAKFLFNFDQNILAILQTAREFCEFFVQHKKSGQEKASHKERELTHWLDSLLLKKSNVEEASPLDHAFEPYLLASKPLEIPGFFKEMAVKSVDGIKALFKKFEK